MSITTEQLQHVAKLAKLSFSPEDSEEMTQRLNDILSMVDELQKADTTNIKPMSHPMDLTQRLREDIAEPASKPKDYQTIAPQTVDNLYLVPKVIE